MGKVKPEDLSKAIGEYLTSYREDIQDDVVEVADKISQEAKDKLKTVSPQGEQNRPKPYYRGWAVKIQQKGKFKYTKVIWNKTNYQLTHLLEFGHRKRNGNGWVDAQPHIQPVEQEYKVKFIDLLEEKIRRTK